MPVHTCRPEEDILSRAAGQRAPRIHLSLLPTLELYKCLAFDVGPEDLNLVLRRPAQQALSPSKHSPDDVLPRGF